MYILDEVDAALDLSHTQVRFFFFNILLMLRHRYTGTILLSMFRFSLLHDNIVVVDFFSWK